MTEATKQAPTQVYKFLLERGSHVQADIKTGENVMYHKGDTFESTIDLRKFNIPGATKFRLIEGFEENLTAASQTTQPQNSEDTLNSMTVAQLRELAAEEEVDLSTASTKKEIIEAIQSATS